MKHSRALVSGAATLLTLTLALSLVVLTSPSASAGREGVHDYSKIAPELDQGTCTDLGRVWIEIGDQVGCSRTRCLSPRGHIVGDYNTEACTIGANQYAVSMDVRVCNELARRWIPEVNRCLAAPRRTKAHLVQQDASPCRAPASTYVVVPQRSGLDLCLTASLAATYQRSAERQSSTLLDVVLVNSATLCSMRADSQWTGQVCRPLRTAETKIKLDNPVWVIGDSVMHRAGDEIADAQPTWATDGQPGTALESFEQRLGTYLSLHTMPKTVVLALGTNNGGRVPHKVDFVRAVERLPQSTRVVFVTPYRDPAVYGKETARMLSRIAAWEKDIARDRDRTCLAPWRTLAAQHPELLVDGVHELPVGEARWAQLAIRSAKACATRWP